MNTRSARSLLRLFLLAFAVVLMSIAPGISLASNGSMSTSLSSGADASLIPLAPDGPATIQGTITYSGQAQGTHPVFVAAFRDQAQTQIVNYVTRSGPGTYSLSVPAGTYYISSGMDANDSGGVDSSDPKGTYANNPVMVADDQVLSNVDIELRDPGPSNQGSISGQVSYTGAVPGTHKIVVVAWRQGETVPAGYAAIDGPGAYTISALADGTYYVCAYMNADDDPQLTHNLRDPIGSYPNAVVISGGAQVTGVDITLVDPRLLFLPLILR